MDQECAEILRLTSGSGYPDQTQAPGPPSLTLVRVLLARPDCADILTSEHNFVFTSTKQDFFVQGEESRDV